METSRRLKVILASFICAAALGCDQPVAPTPRPASLPSGLGTATVAGQVIDADTGQPVSGAVVTIERVTVFSTTRGQEPSPDGVGTSIVSDGGGGFRFEPGVRDNWTLVQLSVRRDGYEPSHSLTFRLGSPIGALVLSLYPTLILRPGESIQTRVHLNHYNCGEWLVPCRRVVVESAPNEEVEVELALPIAPNNGLEAHSDVGLGPYQRRVTLSGGGEVYIVGISSVTLTARRP